MPEGEKGAAGDRDRERTLASRFHVPERSWLPVLLAVGSFLVDAVRSRGYYKSSSHTPARDYSLKFCERDA